MGLEGKIDFGDLDFGREKKEKPVENANNKKKESLKRNPKYTTKSIAQELEGKKAPRKLTEPQARRRAEMHAQKIKYQLENKDPSIKRFSVIYKGQLPKDSDEWKKMKKNMDVEVDKNRRAIIVSLKD